MSDEAHFHLSGYVNKQNCRYWNVKNLKIIHELPLHPQKVTVRCGMTCERIIGHYFFQNEIEKLRVTGAHVENAFRNV